MKINVLILALLTSMCLSCSDDNTPEPDPTDPNNPDIESTIPEKYIGKWKVEYSKTIEGARFQDDGTLEIAEEAVIKEYFGDWGEPNVEPISGIFDNKEIRIDIKKNNTITVAVGGDNNKTINISIKDNVLIWTNNNQQIIEHYVYFENDLLVIERIPTQQFKWIYTISQYSKIEE